MRPTRLLTDVEVVRLDGQRLLGLQLVVGVVHKLEPLQEHAQHQVGLLQGKLPANAGALPRAEGLVGVGGNLGPVLGAESVRVELLGVLAPPLRVAVQHADKVRGEPYGPLTPDAHVASPTYWLCGQLSDISPPWRGAVPRV